MCRIWLTSVLGRKKRAPRLPSPPKICYFASFYFSRLSFTARVYGWLPYDSAFVCRLQKTHANFKLFSFFFSPPLRGPNKDLSVTRPRPRTKPSSARSLLFSLSPKSHGTFFFFDGHPAIVHREQRCTRVDAQRDAGGRENLNAK